MNKADKYLDKELHCTNIGLVRVIEKVTNSRTKVIVKEIDRGLGYDETKKRYVGVKINYSWYRGENFDYGRIHEVHINELKSDSDEKSKM